MIGFREFLTEAHTVPSFSNVGVMQNVRKNRGRLPDKELKYLRDQFRVYANPKHTYYDPKWKEAVTDITTELIKRGWDK